MGATDAPLSRNTLLLLALILAAACVPRFWGLTGTGPYFVDEGEYMLGARWYCETARLLARAVPQWVRTPPADVPAALNALFREAEGHPLVLGRPLHNLLAAVPMLVVGYHPWLGNAVSAVFGVLSLPVLFLLYRRLFGPRGALPATAVLAGLGIHVHYSRTFFPETDSTFFLLVSLLAYLRSRQGPSGLRWIAASGVAWGLAVTASDRWLSMLPILWLLEAHLLLTRAVPWKRSLIRLVVLHAAVGVPILAFGLPDLVLRLVYLEAGVRPPFPSYFRLLLRHFAIAQAMAAARFIDALPVSGFRASDLLIFPHINVHYNGVLCSLFLAAGLVRSVRERGFGDLVVLACLLVPIAYLYLQVYHCMRHFSITYPFVAILVARGLFADRITGCPGWKRILPAGLLLAVLASSVAADAKTVGYPFGYAEAARFLADRPGKVLTSNAAVLQAYLGTERCKASPATEGELTDYVREGYQYLVLDFLPTVWELVEEVGIRHDRDARRLALVREIAERSAPVAVFPNPGAASTDVTFEVLFHYRDAFVVSERIRSTGGDTIRVYRLGPEP